MGFWSTGLPSQERMGLGRPPLPLHLPSSTCTTHPHLPHPPPPPACNILNNAPCMPHLVPPFPAPLLRHFAYCLLRRTHTTARAAPLPPPRLPPASLRCTLPLTPLRPRAALLAFVRAQYAYLPCMGQSLPTQRSLLRLSPCAAVVCCYLATTISVDGPRSLFPTPASRLPAGGVAGRHANAGAGGWDSTSNSCCRFLPLQLRRRPLPPCRQPPTMPYYWAPTARTAQRDA